MAMSEKERLLSQLVRPALGLRTACQAWVASLSLKQRWLLAYHLQCDVSVLARVLHDLNHKKRISRGPAGQGDGCRLPEPREGLEGALRRE